MDKEDKKIEELLRSRIESVRPHNAFFNKILESVTMGDGHRYNKSKEDYKLTSFFMNKFVSIGLPLVAIAIVAVVIVNKPKTQEVAINSVTNSSEAGSMTSPKSDTKVNSNSDSVDAILASLYADSDEDATLANADSEDETYVNSQVDAFNSISTTQYENNI